MTNNQLQTPSRWLRLVAAAALLAMQIPPQAHGQISAGNTGISVRPTGWFSSQGVAFQPAADHPMPLVQNRLSRDAAAVAIGPGRSLPQVYRFAEGLAFSGTIRIRYNEADVTGHDEDNLWIFAQSVTDGPFRPLASVRNITDRFVETTLIDQPILALTLADPTQVGYVLVPETPAVSAITQQGFTLNWPAVAGTTEYRIEIATTSDFKAFVAGYDPVTTGNSTSVAVTGLQSGTAYHFRLSAVDAAGGTVVSPAGETLTDRWKLERIAAFEALEVAHGTTLAEVHLPSTAKVYLENGREETWAVSWDGATPPYQADRSGTYVFNGVLTPSIGAFNPENRTATITVTVKEGTLTGVTLDPATVTYNGLPHLLAVQNLPVGATVSYTLLDEHLEATTGNSATDAGVYTVSALIKLDGYADLELTARLIIKSAVRTLNFPLFEEKTFGDADFATGAAISSGEVLDYSSDNLSVAEIVAGRIRIIGTGKAMITATAPANGNYVNTPSAGQMLTVRKANQTISFNSPAEVSRDAGSMELLVSASSGLPVSLSLDDPEVASLDGTVLNILQLGTVHITATQVGDENHEPATPVTVIMRVNDPSAELPIRVSKAVSPNGDGINEYLVVEAIKDYPENRVSVFNRNGTIVYEASGYNNGTVAFRGIGAGQINLPAGTYFYVAEIKIDGKWEYEKGWFVLRY